MGEKDQTDSVALHRCGGNPHGTTDKPNNLKNSNPGLLETSRKIAAANRRFSRNQQTQLESDQANIQKSLLARLEAGEAERGGNPG